MGLLCSISIALLLLISFPYAALASLPVPPGNPVANAKAQVVVNPQVRFTLLSSSLIRMEYQPESAVRRLGTFEDRQTIVVWNRNVPIPSFATKTLGNVTTIATSSFVLTYTAGIAPGFTSANLQVSLRSPRLWTNVTTWQPGDQPDGNLYGTFHTLDGLEGWQSMNCTVDNAVWNGAGFGSQPLAHCAWGLISKAGWALVDDSRSPVLDGAWPAPQLSGVCDSAPVSARVACFQDPNYNPDNDSIACAAAGCCFAPGPAPVVPLNLFYSASRHDYYTDAACMGCATLYNFVDFQAWAFQDGGDGLVQLNVYWNPRAPGGDNALVTSPPTVPGYSFVRTVGYAYAPTGAQPHNTSALKLWYNTTVRDYYTTASAEDEQRAVSGGYKFVSLLGYVITADANTTAPMPVPPYTPMCYQRSGNVDWYLFTHGTNYTGALADFAQISGPIPVPRRHWLGVSWSRWGSEWTQAATYQQVQNLTIAGFPLSTYVFDMNWHLKPDWTGYTWDTHQYPDPAELCAWLHGKGLQIGANLHDAQGVMSFEALYPAMAKANGINPATKQTVAFRISNETFADTLSEVVLEPLAVEGFDFWWTDWQQGEDLGVPDCTGLNPTFMLNHYRFMNYSGSAKRGLLHSRWGGLGNHRYVSGFGGDVVQSWESLQFMIYFTATATNVLFGYWGHEMMALQNEPLSPPVLELFARVMQFGAFSPIYTNWGNDGSDDNVWQFPAIYQSAVQRALATRLQLLPYLYTLSRVAHDTALSPLRPMYYAYPTLEEAYDAQLQYMIGDTLLVAPVTSPVSNTTGLASVTIWCPPLAAPSGVEPYWRALDDPTQLLPADGRYHNVSYPLSRTPVFVPDGALLPVLPYAQAVQLGVATQPSYSRLELWAFPSSDPAASASAWVYEDDGMSSAYLSGAAGTFANTSFTLTRNATCAILRISTSGTYPSMVASRNYTVRALSFTPEPSAVGVVANGTPLPLVSVTECSATTAPPGSWCPYAASPYTSSRYYSVCASLPTYPIGEAVTVTFCV